MLLRGLNVIEIVLLAITICAFNTAAANTQNFSKAKKELVKIYKVLDRKYELKTFYCNCPLLIKRNKFRFDVDDSSCYSSRKNTQRSTRIEYEHVVPAYAFGHQLQCWQQGGRKSCKKDDAFNLMEGDMHNLFPAIGEINGDRSNFRFIDSNLKAYQYGSCPIVVDFKHRQVQPPQTAKGQIARAYLYMADRYGLKLNKRELKRFKVWDHNYPATDFECDRNKLIQEVQGNDNPFITRQCHV